MTPKSLTAGRPRGRASPGVRTRPFSAPQILRSRVPEPPSSGRYRMPFRFSFHLPAMPLRRHLLALVLVTLLPMLVLGATLAAWLATERSESVEHGLRATAKALALAIDREAAANLAALEGLAASDALAADDLPAFHDRAVLAPRQHPNWRSLVLLDPAGRPLLHTGG